MEVSVFNKLSVAKFGGSLIDPQGLGIPKILKRIRELKGRDGFGPIAVFSAPMGFTDELIEIGESCAQKNPASTSKIFGTYRQIASLHAKGAVLDQALIALSDLEARTQAALDSINKRFSGNTKAKVLTLAGELASSTLLSYVLNSNGINSSSFELENWPIITDDNFEDATPNFELSKKKIGVLLEPLQNGKVISLAGFLGVTSDGLETILGRGGSDLTAVFVSCLLSTHGIHR